jgi:Zn-dependent protease
VLVQSEQTFTGRLKQMLAPLAVALTALAKFAPFVLKTGGTMFLSIFLYAQIWGWRFAVGFVLLIFVHETGHLIAARMMGLPAGWPVFIPFMGAVIALKEAPRNAWIEAIVGIGGPILGSVGALAAYAAAVFTDNPLFMALAYFGFFLNLVNLIPIIPLDGGRIVAAISPWLWVVGFVLLIPVLIWSHNIFIMLLVVMSLPRVLALFKKRSDVERRYFECTRNQRLFISTLYFVLLAGLGFMMTYTHRFLNGQL